MSHVPIEADLYVASRCEHAPLWRALRDRRSATRVRVRASWIDEAEPGQTKNMGELWARIRSEMATADALLIYRARPDEVLKGAYVELGMALAEGMPIFAVGFDTAPIHSFMRSPIKCRTGEPYIIHYPSIDAAVAAIPERTVTWWGE